MVCARPVNTLYFNSYLPRKAIITKKVHSGLRPGRVIHGVFLLLSSSPNQKHNDLQHNEEKSDN